MTRTKLEALLHTYPLARATRWHRSTKNPFTIVGYYSKDLRHAAGLEIIIAITHNAAMAFRVYPSYVGQGPYINLDKARDPSGLMQGMLQSSYRSFFFWGADDASDIFAGYEFTLESGFPEEAIKVVIRSIPLIDESVGELVNWID